jgi:hypothetical protein
MEWLASTNNMGEVGTESPPARKRIVYKNTKTRSEANDRKKMAAMV